MSSQIRIVKVSAEIEKDEFDIKVSHWKLLLETNRYYEIKPESGPVKRIYKEKLNTVVDETKSYTDGFLSCSAFCAEERVNEMQLEMLRKLQLKINSYRDELQLNQKALEEQQLQLKTGKLPEPE
ncbi:hypothetical protein C2I18_01195 [Paenibacillus sp. PK3_47]|uniref:hypothetical protein n=1 Tax=Paenibacillus sp. PK3_47 TaxID=2072642 RepID=UPI00201D8D14|nr:hypothetical protein [Paenibacillus sp. PK3_47]UQZ32281.1 hypothetical protein C2I18_01195 [Paenibacillus sp. PK3_47]